MNEWWVERLPRDNETPGEASERLWRTLGFAGSLEDAIIAVADAMAMERERKHHLRIRRQNSGRAA